jgi:hypothetical protein
MDPLLGLRVALSASIPPVRELDEVGLTPEDVAAAAGALARSIVVAGGVVVFCGRLQPGGLTGVVVDEARRHANGRVALRLLVPELEYGRLSSVELQSLDARLAPASELRLVSSRGEAVAPTQARFGGRNADVAAELTALRRFAVAQTDARIALGGACTGVAGAEPGIVEEARLSLAAGAPVVALAGFGGAAADLGRWLRPDDHPRWRMVAGREPDVVATVAITALAALRR